MTAAEMQAAEQLLFDQGVSVNALMAKAGEGAAQQIWRISGNMPTLVLCGPGNNGGDGYVIAQWLLNKGVNVAVASLSDPKTDAARHAKSLWKGQTENLADATPRLQIIDCLFGTGLSRPLENQLVEQLEYLTDNAHRKIAIDLPSGVDSDSGALLGCALQYDITIALGAYKPAHFLEPSRSQIGNLIGVEIGVSAKSALHISPQPQIQEPAAKDHKYSRGLVAVIAGSMPGAANLTAHAAQVSGAGYVKLFSTNVQPANSGSLVHEIYTNQSELSEMLSDKRISIVVVGPGLGRDKDAASLLETIMSSDKPLLLDADALNLLGEDFADRITSREKPVIATPHTGEFLQISKKYSGSKIEQSRMLAKQSNSTIVFKGSDTVIASADGSASLSEQKCSWLSTAGTGDVLAGIIASRFAVGNNGFLAAEQGQWLHTRAAQLAGPAFSPERLIQKLPDALAECL